MPAIRPSLLRRLRPAQPTRLRAQLPALRAMPPPPATPSYAPTHDFLVPNPRPDLASVAWSAR
ncbi:MAG: hypothetical protein ABIZ49_12445 [Opitutaceae bacterium]